MRVLFSGDRHWDGKCQRAQAHMDELPPDTVIVVGDCPTGLDHIVRWHAAHTGKTLETHTADWEAYGKAAGPKRNQQMVDSGVDEAYFYLTPHSRGTRHCLKAARAAGVPVHVTNDDWQTTTPPVGTESGQGAI